MTIEEVIDWLDDIKADAIYSLLDIEIQAFDKAIETLEKVRDGKMIEKPCEVGDTFYGIQGENVFEYECLSVKLGDSNSIYLVTTYDMEFLYGEEAFLSEKEAEKVLKVRKRNERFY